MAYPRCNIKEAVVLVEAAAAAHVPVLLVGPPGVGKTSIFNQTADKLKLPFYVLTGSQLDPTDIGGFPLAHKDEHGPVMQRVPLLAIRQCVRAPGFLLVDEMFDATPSVLATERRLLLDRDAGDEKLHQDSVVMAATNPPEQSASGGEFTITLVGRVTIVELEPTMDEVADWFKNNLGKEGSALRAEACSFAATLQVEPRLLQIQPPPASVTGGAPWGAPRNWERGLRLFTPLKEAGAEESIQFAALAGAVGEDCAVSWRALERLRRDLPSIDAVCRDPAGCLVPPERDRQVAAIGLVARVADRDTWAAWIYAERLHPEIAMACARVLYTRKPTANSPHAGTGARSRATGAARVAQARVTS